MTRLFLSYSRNDHAFAQRIAEDVNALGVDVWFDTDDIPAGIKWSSAIQQALDSTDIMIVLITPASMASQNVEDEWQYFRDQKKPIVPVLLQPARIHFQLSRIQYVDFYKQPYHVAFKHLKAELSRKGVQFGTAPDDPDDTVELATGTPNRTIGPQSAPIQQSHPTPRPSSRGLILSSVALAVVLLTIVGIGLAISAFNAASNKTPTDDSQFVSTATAHEDSEQTPHTDSGDKISALLEKYKDSSRQLEFLQNLPGMSWSDLDYQNTVEVLADIYLNLGGWPELEPFIVDSGLEDMLGVPVQYIGTVVAFEKYSGDKEQALSVSQSFGLINDNNESTGEFELTTQDESFDEKLKNYQWIDVNWGSDDHLILNVTVDFDELMDSYSTASEMLYALVEIAHHETVTDWRAG